MELYKLNIVESNGEKLIQLLDENNVVVKVSDCESFQNKYENDLIDLNGTHSVVDVIYEGRWRHSLMEWSGYIIRLKLHEFKTCEDSEVRLIICDFYTSDEGQKSQLLSKFNSRGIKVKNIDLVYSFIKSSLKNEPEVKEGFVLDYDRSIVVTESEFKRFYNID